MSRKNVRPRLAVFAGTFVVLCLAGLPGCDSRPAGVTLDDLSGWMYVVPNPATVGVACTRSSYIYNSHASDTVFVDSVKVDTIHWVGFHVMPRDTIYAVEENGLIYQSAGTYIHTLTYYTEIGVLTCPPCTVVVRPAR